MPAFRFFRQRRFAGMSLPARTRGPSPTAVVLYWLLAPVRLPATASHREGGAFMHVLFIHQNFPAQFGHIAAYLVRHKGFRATFVSQQPPGIAGLIERIQYQVRGGATEGTHYCSRTFENAVWHGHAVFEALASRPDLRPDLVVAHSGFVTTVFLRELFDCPIINYFEFFYHTRGSDMDFRPDFPSPVMHRLRARARNAALLLDLNNCDLGYSPTRWQASLFPPSFREKLRVVFDGVDTSTWRPLPAGPRRIGNWTVPEGTRVITYVARGMESMRGFDIFMQAARLVCMRRSDVHFVVVGEDRVCYGGDREVIGKQTFKEWVLSRDDYDLSRFHFTGLLAPSALAQLLSWTDLHIYLTVPFVLSWSLMDALACGAIVLASDTAPVREMIEHGKNGLLTDFFDIQALAHAAQTILGAPADYKHLGRAGADMIREHYSLEVCLPRMLRLYEEAAAVRRSS
jgi:glycosyltransferase involved in cell wall biosynthesis